MSDKTYAVVFIPRKPAGEIYSLDDALKIGGHLARDNMTSLAALQYADQLNYETRGITGMYIKVFQ